MQNLYSCKFLSIINHKKIRNSRRNYLCEQAGGGCFGGDDWDLHKKREREKRINNTDETISTNQEA